MSDTTVRQALFDNEYFHGCSNGDCIIKKRTGMRTNGSCGCLHDMSRSELYMLKSKLTVILDMELKPSTEESE